MSFFACMADGKKDSSIQEAVIAGNPILEAFGNAKTIRNNNSSRFGRFMQLDVNKTGGILLGKVQCFLLEKSRIVGQSQNERTYHIFYQLLKGATAEQRSKYYLQSSYKYISNNDMESSVPGIDDVKEFGVLKEAFKKMRFTDKEVDEIFKCISSVLLIGEIEIGKHEFNGIPDAARIENSDVLTKISYLLQLDEKDLKNALLEKVINSPSEQNEIHSNYKQSEAIIIRDSFAKALYINIFEWLIKKLNQIICPEKNITKFIAILDIFGFEVFKTNSLEQFFINITNEMLQKNFVDIVFHRESILYKEEGISFSEITWTTNKPIIDLLTAKSLSIISCLEDVCMAPGGDDHRFVHQCNTQLASNSYYSKSKIGGGSNFIVTHTIGDIQYCADNFTSKNRDLLRFEVVSVLKASKSPVVKDAFSTTEVVKGKIGKNQLISSTFLTQLNNLMKIINETEAHFIRCLKPNEIQAPLHYTPSKVLVQLHSLSIFEALQLRNLGYSYRRPFNEFLLQFKYLAISVEAPDLVEPKAIIIAIMQKYKIGKSDYQIGKTMVFVKKSSVKELVVQQREILSAWSSVVVLLESMYKVYQFEEAFKPKIKNLIRLQAHARAYCARQ
ncbi:myosin-A-like [Dermatophagoides farinae]|uniref:myosin-A-like n=1 Tax=Dermatophagoides farinae TaxID=6954 RepID=UPI003F5D9BE9